MLIETIILGFIQGLTEWIPVSSTGHLKIAEYFLGVELPLFFDLIFHVGTLIVTLFFFFSDIKKIIHSLHNWEFKSESGKIIPLILIGTMPTAIIGFLIVQYFDAYFNNLFLITSAYFFCGIVLYLSKIGKNKKNEISYFDALKIGIFQGIAVIPGLSRSGFTIAIALLLGIKKDISFKFSFLLSIPAIIGGLVLTIFEQILNQSYIQVNPGDILIGITVSAIVGYFSLKLLKKSLEIAKFHLFAFYCWFLSFLLIILVVLGF